MKDTLLKIREDALSAIAQPGADLEAIRIPYLGKKGELTAVLKQMGKLSAEERPVMGQLANSVRAEIESMLEQRKTAINAAVLEAKLASVSETYNAQIIVCTIASVDGADIERYLNYLYDTMGFGYGDDRDGVLLLVCMDPREFWTLSNGYAGVAIGDSEIDAISDAIVSDMSDGNYGAAFEEFADQCAYYLDGYINGFPFNVGKNLLIALIIGIAVGLIVVFALKAQLKSVQKQDRANAYVKKDSMNLTHQSDIYLYRTVSRSKKSSSGSSSGGGGTARSTGGRSF